MNDEVDLHAMTSDEAVARLDDFLYDSFMAGLGLVRIIHGKGTGTLRLEVRRRLAGHTLVKSFRPGGRFEGGQGVTMVELSSK